MLAKKETLTPREFDILLSIALGYNAEEIAKQLNLAVETIKSHKRNIYAKLGAKNAPNAVYLGMQNSQIMRFNADSPNRGHLTNL